MFKFLLAAALAVMATVPAKSQVSKTLVMGLQNPAMMSMEINRNTVSFKLPTNVTPGPKEMPNAVEILIKSNVKWEMNALITSDFQSIDDNTATIPGTQMEYRCRYIGTESGVACQEQSQPFVKNQTLFVARGGPTPDQGIGIITDYLLKITLKDPAGSYTLPITYTLSPSQ